MQRLCRVSSEARVGIYDNNRRNRWRFPLAHMVLTFCMVASLASQGIAADERSVTASDERKIEFNIAEQPLSSALHAFAGRTGWEVSSVADLPEGKMSPGVQGSHTPEDGLTALLTGTGLTYRLIGPQTVTIERDASPSAVPGVRGTTAGTPAGAAVSDADDQKPINLPEIRVLGDKLDRAMKDIPQGVTLFHGETILRQAVTTSSHEVFYRTPNVTVGEAANGSFSIRGVNNNNVVRNTDTGANGSITVFNNLVPMSFSSFDYAPPSLWDVKTVEVFKGPQSTTQGPNSLAGAVLYNYHEPDLKYYDGRARMQWGSFNTLNAAIVQNLPIIDDKLAVRFSYEKQSSDGAIHNRTIGIDDWADVDRNTFRGQALLRPFKSRDLEAKLTVTHDRIGDNAATPAHGGTTPFFDRINSNDIRDRNDIGVTVVGLTVDGRLSNHLNITSISGFNNVDLNQFFDGGGTPVADGFLNFFRKENIGSQEVRVKYATGSFRGVVGVFGQYGHYDSGFDFPIPGAGIFVKRITDHRWNAAVFGDVEYDLTDRLSAGAGLRIHHEDYEITMGQNLFGAGFQSQSTQRSDTVPLPKAHVSYKLFDNLKIGALVSRGFRSGGGSVTYSPQFAGVETSSYGPEYTWNYEGFFRSIWLDGQLLFDGNGFFVDWQDMIVSIPTIGQFGTTNTVTTNAASARTHGFELQLTYSPVRQVRFPVGLGYAHTEFTDFTLDAGQNVAGQEFPNAPQWSFNAGVDYRADNGLFATTTFSYRSSSYSQVQNPNSTRLQPRELLSAKAGYATAHWSAYVFGNNLLNDDYAVLLYQQPGAPFITGNSGLPRMVGFGVEAYW